MKANCKQFAGGVLVGACIAAAVLGGPMVLADQAAGSAAGAQSAPAKSTSKVVFENERVRVKDVTFPAGVLDTGMHTHDLPHVGVILTPGALTFTEPGKPADTVKFASGSVGFREANVTHQVGNPGKAAMRVIEVELK